MVNKCYNISAQDGASQHTTRELFLGVKHLNDGLTHSLEGVLVEMSHVVVHGVPSRTETALLAVGIIRDDVDGRNLRLLVIMPPSLLGKKLP